MCSHFVKEPVKALFMKKIVLRHVFFADAIRQIMLVMVAFLFCKGYHDKEQGEKCGQVYRHQLQADMICNQSKNRRHKRRAYIGACHLNANNPL